MDVKPLRAVAVRWLIRDDLAAVLAIEAAGFDRPWGAADLARALRGARVAALAAEAAGEVAGYVLYAVRGQTVDVLRLAVAPAHRRRGVGRQLLDRLEARLAPSGPLRLVAEVHERWLDAQSFLRACGCRAVAVRRAADPDTGDDLYVFTRVANRPAVTRGRDAS
jgi:ribosomal-protein-alanine N-acetyltransferase